MNLPESFSVQLLTPTAKLPARATADAAGLDLHADMDGVIVPGGRLLVKTGIKIAIPSGFEGQVRPRSGLALKQGVTVLNSPGTIDADYRGEVGVILINQGTADFRLAVGDRIAQLVIAQVAMVAPRAVADLDETARGSGGFGHTGQ